MTKASQGQNLWGRRIRVNQNPIARDVEFLSFPQPPGTPSAEPRPRLWLGFSHLYAP